MALRALLTASILGISISSVLAQESQITWAAFTYTYHGEKVPTSASGPYNLTPLGAQQSLLSGSLIRDRYIQAPKNGSQLTTYAPIHGLSINDIDNEQLIILSTDDEFVSASAMAFMQGLYPPRGLVVDAESMLGNGTLEQYPLGGYQYPNIGSLGDLDFNYIWLAGNIGCNNYDINTAKSRQNHLFTSLITTTESFYQSLNQTLFWSLPPTSLSYYNAYPLYEYALYQYTHNYTIQDVPNIASILQQLYTLASTQQWYLNSQNSTDTNSSSINTISGRTLTSKIIQQFEHTIASFGVSDKLTLLFGSFEPMLAFFSLSLLSQGPAASRFQSLPLHGSSMTFELFSYTIANETTNPTFPSTKELFVRFLFRNGTGDLDPLISYPLFGRGNSEVDMSWRDFVMGMGEFGVEGVEDWCASCSAETLYCEAIAFTSSSSSSSASSSASGSGGGGNGITPVVAGVIGAVVTSALFVVVGVGLLLGGWRIGYLGSKRSDGDEGVEGGVKRNSSERTTTGGGFKGKEKLASDLDLTIAGKAGGGARHERVGSWELHDSPTGANGSGKAAFGEDIGEGRVRSMVDYDRRSLDEERDVGDLHGLKGVEGHEHV